MHNIPRSDITAVILAGGQGRRMGGEDKGLVTLNGRPLIAHVLSAIEPQVDRLLLNANRNADQYRRFGHPLISDSISGYQGPLAGFASALQVATTPYLVTLPCDAPHPPADYVERMGHKLTAQQADIAVAHDGHRLQPVHALISCRLLADLIDYLTSGERKIDRWYARHHWVTVDFSDCAAAFSNINTPGDRDNLQQGGAAA